MNAPVPHLLSPRPDYSLSAGVTLSMSLFTPLPKHVQLTQGHAKARARDWTESGSHQEVLNLHKIPLKPKQAELLITVLDQFPTVPLRRHDGISRFPVCPPRRVVTQAKARTGAPSFNKEAHRTEPVQNGYLVLLRRFSPFLGSPSAPHVSLSLTHG